jgi:hypothetical protein
MVRTKEEYLERVKGYKPKAFAGGERIRNLLTDSPYEDNYQSSR